MFRFTFIALMLSACLATAGELKLGKPLSPGTPLSVEELMSDPGKYVGKEVQVKGKVSAVCQMAGCWMLLTNASGQKSVRIKVKDGDIVFPKDASGKTAIAEGKLVRLEMTREQALARAGHEAAEMDRKFDPKSVKGGTVTYQIQGTGALLMD